MEEMDREEEGEGGGKKTNKGKSVRQLCETRRENQTSFLSYSTPRSISEQRLLHVLTAESTCTRPPLPPHVRHSCV